MTLTVRPPPLFENKWLFSQTTILEKSEHLMNKEKNHNQNTFFNLKMPFYKYRIIPPYDFYAKLDIYF